MKNKHVAVLLLLLCLCGYTLAQQNDAPRGVESSAVEKTPKHIKWLESKSDDARSGVAGQQPLAPLKRVASDKEQMLSAPEALAPTPLWKKLERLDFAERENASIQLEFSPNLPLMVRREAENIETLWNRGDYAQAIERLRILEASNGKADIAIGIAWKVPRPVQNSILAADVQIGTRTNLQLGVLDFDAASGNLFAALKLADNWTVNISTDDGVTWQESFLFVSGGININDITAAVHSGFFYVLYVSDTNQFETRARRFLLTNGSSDASYDFKVVFNKGVVVKDLAVAATEDFAGQRIYALAILANGSVVYHFSTETGLTWTEIQTGITSADHGLDAHTNQGGAIYFLTISYVSADGRLHVARRTFTSQWIDTNLSAATIAPEGETSIAAYQDRTMVVYDSATGIDFFVSYNGGSSWFIGTVASGTSFFRPHVAGRRGGGFLAVYQEEVGEPDRMWYRHRDYGVGPGTAEFGSPVQFNEVDVQTGSPVSAEWIPPLTQANHFGAVWIGGTANNGIFDRIEGAPAQLFQGPATGNIAGGAIVNTNSFPITPQQQPDRPQEAIPLRDIEERLRKGRINPIAPTGPVGSNFIEDRSGTAEQAAAPNLLTNFAGIEDIGTSIPPDPHMAAGPNHVMATVNRQFAIYNKTGTRLKLINAVNWFANVNPDGGPFDPQIVYDHHAARWIMVWISFTANPPRSSLLLSVSDDSDPIGGWCIWRLPGNQNGSTPNTFLNDYEKIGLDANAIYVTANMFDILPPGAFQYVQLRIIPKAQLLGASCGPVTWKDFWDLRNPGDLTEPVFTTVPAVTFGTPGTEYFVDVDFINNTGTFMNLWSLTNPLSATPGLTAATVPVAAFTEPPNANQLGGGTPLIDVGGRRNRNVVYQNGSVWTAHSVGNATGQFANARYVKINVNTRTATEDVAFGAANFWHYYPAVQPDGSGNLVMAFTRSGTNEFASARFTGRLTSDPPGLQASAELKAGEDNYVKTFGGPRNRWGDYMGIALDPANGNNVWMFVEYAETAVGPGASDDRWGTWFGSVSFGISTCTFCGDVNLDGLVNSTDALVILAFDVGQQIPPAFLDAINRGCGDVNLDGATNSTDALIILTCDAGLPQCPPNVGKPGGCR